MVVLTIVVVVCCVLLCWIIQAYDLAEVNGVMIYVDPDGGVLGYEDVFTKINLCRAHYEKVGLGAGYVDQFIR